MKLKISYLILFTLIVNILSANATIRYVSKTGTSTPPYTSWQSAADSIQKCINICVDGDTIYVANGIYKENLVINTQIFLSGLSMDSTVIDGTGLLDNTLRVNKNTEINNFCIFGRGSNYSNSVIVFSYADSTIIMNCLIQEAGSGIFIRSSCLINNVFINRISVSGIANFGSSTNVFNTIQNCSMFFELDNSEAINVGVGIYNIHNNIITFNSGINQNPRNGISISVPKKVHISNNIISEFSTNIFVEAPTDTILIKNNILINQNSTSVLTSGGGWVVVNNVIFNKNKIGIRGNWRVDSDYNMFWENLTNFIGVTMGDSDRVADPMFVKDTIPNANSNYDFHLQAYSPAIDKGNPDILDLDGTRSDIGMYGGPFGETYTYQDLAPLAPRNLSAVIDSNNITVSWKRNTEADTAFYKVYRDTVINFQIDSTKLISSPTDTFFVQLPPYNSSKYVFKITCVDNHGNESKPSQELVVNITSVSTNDYPMTISDYVLYQNYPNPFNPSTKIGYQLKQRANVKIMVYDIKGELISVLVNKEQNAGYYEAEFSSSSIKNPVSSIQNIASGIYLYRIEVIGEGNIPVYTEMKKMILIK